MQGDPGYAVGAPIFEYSAYCLTKPLQLVQHSRDKKRELGCSFQNTESGYTFLVVAQKIWEEKSVTLDVFLVLMSILIYHKKWR